MKRLFDLALVLFAAPAWVPALLIVGLMVRIRLGGPVLFRQVRPGLDGEPFEMIKFRTMTDARGEEGELLPDAHRMTAFGRWLRAASLDELPELLNVLRGEMSLVGPRPLLMEYLSLYSAEQGRRHRCRPGITGWAQVNGRNAITWDEKFQLDVWYVDHSSILLDVRILFITFVRVFSRHGISQQGEVTMSKFTGGPS